MRRLTSLFGLGFIGLVLSADLVQGQIIPDGTLGTQTTNNCLTIGINCGIAGGSQRGGNLFHSFEQFSLPNGGSASFLISPNVENAIVRVTGIGDAFSSVINGSIATLNLTGTQFSQPVDFFLLNPNGVVFGPNSRLVVGGSFLATTAEQMRFADGSVLTTQAETPVLTVAVPTGLQIGQAPRGIQMIGVGLQAGTRDSFTDFALVGGDLLLDSSIIIAPERQVTLASLGEGNSVLLSLEPGLKLEVDDAGLRGKVELRQRSGVSVTGLNGGGLSIVAQNFEIDDTSELEAGLRSGSTTESQAGDVVLDVSEQVTIQGASISNFLQDGAFGRGGKVVVKTRLLDLLDGGRLASLILSGGNGIAGDVTVTAEAIELQGTALTGRPSAIGSLVLENAVGTGGNVAVTTRTLSASDGAQVGSDILGQGNAGNLHVEANSIILNELSVIRNEVLNSVVTGNAGKVTVKTGTLRASGGSRVSASTFGQGRGGDIAITADSLVFQGTAPDGSPSGIVSENSSPKTGGNIDIQTDSIELSDGASISTATEGEGNAGSIDIASTSIALRGTASTNGGPTAIFSGVRDSKMATGNAGNIELTTTTLDIENGAVVAASTAGQGKAGNVTVTAKVIKVSGSDASGNPGGIASQVSPTGKGVGGDVTVTTDRLALINGGQVSASTGGQGNAGNVNVTATEIIELKGTTSTNSPSSVASEVAIDTARGDGGNVKVMAPILNIVDGATISTSTGGQGKAGNVLVIAGVIRLDGTAPNGSSGGIASETTDTATGDGGQVTVNATNTIDINNGAAVSTTAGAQNRGGDISITTPLLRLDNQGLISAASNTSDGGDVSLNVSNSLLMRRGSAVLSNAGGNGGEITITSPSVISFPKENNDIIANAVAGSGGNITINAASILNFKRTTEPQVDALRSNSTNDISASSQTGSPGTLNLAGFNIDPSQGSNELPANLIAPADQVSRRCAADRLATTGQSGFYITGRSGLPTRPSDPPTATYSTGSVTNTADASATTLPAAALSRELDGSATISSLTEAGSWKRDHQGNIQLIANHSQTPKLHATHCPNSHNS